MDARANAADRLVACAGCAMAPLCEAAQPMSGSLSAVECRRRLERGQVLFAAGSRQDSMFAVRAGFLKTLAPAGGSEHVVQFLMPGDVAGLEGFGPRMHAGSAVALEKSEVCEISLRRAQSLSDAFPHVAAHLRRLLGRQLASTQAHAAALAHLSAPQRLAAFLVDCARRWSERGFASDHFRLPMERREIADYLGLTIETVSRLLTEFRARGWISVAGREVRIHDAHALRLCPRQP
ncbi:hypothetical protein BWI17_21690 [Betaproteobacteria bacterium GR16-43]|nr:hypothetical protein BWI17_21690 [Betaproteobacteria bacterium GR16-43]